MKICFIQGVVYFLDIESVSISVFQDCVEIVWKTENSSEEYEIVVWKGSCHLGELFKNN